MPQPPMQPYGVAPQPVQQPGQNFAPQPQTQPPAAPPVPAALVPQILQPQPQYPPQNSLLVSNSAIAQEFERHTRFLSTLGNIDKAFRLEVVVLLPNGKQVTLEKRYTQADQGSDMNVVSKGLVHLLGLELRSLDEVGFRGLSILVADHRERLLHHYVWLRVSVEGIVRDIRCFVAPDIPHSTETGHVEYLSLILGVPWLYSVDAVIAIKQSKVMVGDVSVGEQVREVVGPELVFCKDHNLLMYPKSVIELGKVEELESDGDDDDSSSSSESDEGDDISDVEDPPQHFL